MAVNEPQSSDWTGRRVWVCFDYEYDQKEPGTLVRDDPEMPTVIQLDSGRTVLGTECQWRPM